MSDEPTPQANDSLPADDALPPVEAPGVGFIMQLFFIPLVIVMIIVMLWLMFSYFAHMGTNPKDLVTQIEKLNDGSWQKASALADLLNNPQNEHLKHDRELAQRIATLLENEIETGSVDEKRLRLRMFLCLVLGEFRVETGMPALLKAARSERTEEEAAVRRTALEALAALTSNVGPENISDRGQLEQELLAASHERDNQLRQTAAFALGVLGSDAAIDRLAVMLGDSYPNTRYNAAAALARNGDPRAERRLLEMLDPNNERAFTEQDLEGKREEQIAEGKRWKRSLVLSNGIKASVILAQENPEYDPAALRSAIEKLLDPNLDLEMGPLPAQVKFQAQEALDQLKP